MSNREDARVAPQRQESQAGEEEQSYLNPFPALPVFNSPVFSQELQDNLPPEHQLPLDSWHEEPVIRRPPANRLGGVYSSRREAWRATGWVHCRDFLGSGGYGRVFLGFRYEDRHSDLPLMTRKLCAIKEVLMKTGTADAVDEAIAAEAYVLRACAHRNIVRLFDNYCIPVKNTYYFVLEFADAKDLLHEIVSGNQSFLWEEYARGLFIGIASGLSYLHDRGVGHRDVKPENILLTISPDGQTKVPKIADFGLSCLFKGKKKPDGSREQFVQEAACGSKHYVAPELHFIQFGWRDLSHFDLRRPIHRSEEDADFDLPDERMASNGVNRRPLVPFTKEFRERFYRRLGIDARTD